MLGEKAQACDHQFTSGDRPEQVPVAHPEDGLGLLENWGATRAAYQFGCGCQDQEER